VSIDKLAVNASPLITLFRSGQAGLAPVVAEDRRAQRCLDLGCMNHAVAERTASCPSRFQGIDDRRDLHDRL